MAATPENKVKQATRKVLDAYNCYTLPPVQNGMGAPALDFHCICNGFGFCVETKAPGKKPSPRQLVTISKIEAAKGKVFVIDGDTTELEEWLKDVSSR